MEGRSSNREIERNKSYGESERGERRKKKEEKNKKRKGKVTVGIKYNFFI
mgnify:CR=1 FL=1